MVFARQVDGQELTFGVSGKLIMNAVVMYDHQTDSLWSQFLGMAVDGPFANTPLELLPSQITTWEAWTGQHPGSVVMRKYGRRSDSYTSYYRNGSAGILGEEHKDTRLPLKDFVVGVDYAGGERAYPLRYLEEQPVVNDTLAGAPVLVAFDAQSDTAAVFLRAVEGQALTFEATPQRQDGAALVRDRETLSLWNAATGVAVSGPHEGRRLERVPSFVSFWFAWTDFHPDTELFELSQG